jgi:class 3 adenylate cyclase
VNEASRLTEIAKGRTVKVLASAESLRRAGSEASHWRNVGTVALRGRATPTAVYEPVALEPTVPRRDAMGSTEPERRS